MSTEKMFKTDRKLKKEEDYIKVSADYNDDYEIDQGDAKLMEKTEVNAKETSSGAIKFRNNKRKTKLKMVLKGCAFVLIASISGGATAAIMVNQRLKPSTGSIISTPENITGIEVLNPVSSSLPKNNISRVAEEVGPAVVGISNNADNFFGNSISKFTGTGIIFEPDGYIVTNYHVIEGADKIMVKLPVNSLNPFEAKLVGVDKTSDIAVLKIEAKGLIYARFATSSKVRVGDTAIAIGNPLGQEFAGSVTAGIISANNRIIKSFNTEIGREVIYKTLQTDAAINPGSSGGPLCNEAGEVIGIVSMNINRDNVEGMGFAICSDEVIKVIKDIKEHGEVERPDFGINGGTAQYEGSNGVKGVYVQEVYTDTGAQAAGILPMDIITDIDSVKISSWDEFTSLIEKKKIGDEVKCKLWRNGKVIEVKVKITKKP